MIRISSFSKHSIIHDMKLHFIIILIFIGLTVIMTWPVSANFDSEIAGQGIGDPLHMLWRFWMIKFSLENGLDPFNTNLIFYPDGINTLQHNIFSTGVAYFLQSFFSIELTWNIIWLSSFVLGGYSCFLLARKLTGNFIASIIAGIIFTFSTYHFAHGLVHIGLTVIFWIPIFVLFLYRTSESKSVLNPILAGVFLFLVSTSHFYYSYYMILFAIIFLVFNYVKRTELTKSQYIKNTLIFIIVSILLVSLIVLPSLGSISESYKHRDISEHSFFSLSLEYIFVPAPLHSIHSFSDYVIPQSIYEIAQIQYNPHALEWLVYLGFGSLILSGLAIYWNWRRSLIQFWCIVGGFFLLFSLGPELKIFVELTGIPLPYQLLYQVPGLDFFRAPARFIIIVILATAILSAFGISNISKKFNLKPSKQMILGCCIAVIILVELSVIPYPTTELSIHEIYDTIANDERNIAVLEAPIGGYGDIGMYSNEAYQYYQTVHKKPIIGGFEVHVPTDIQRDTQSYFLNIFTLHGNNNDVIKQDIRNVGKSILNHMNIGYIVFHKISKNPDPMSDTQILYRDFISRTKIISSEIFENGNPIYEDDEVILYRVSSSVSSEPFVLLGGGWDILVEDNNKLIRYAEPNAEILIVNPTQDIIIKDMELKLRGIIDSQQIMFSINEKSDTITATNNSELIIELSNIELKPGTNLLEILSNEHETYFTNPEYGHGEEYQFSFIVSSIVLE